MSVVGQQRRPSVRCKQCGTDLMALKTNGRPEWFCPRCRTSLTPWGDDPAWERCHDHQRRERVDWSSVLR